METVHKRPESGRGLRGRLPRDLRHDSASVRAPLIALLVWSLALPACGGKAPEELRARPEELPFRVDNEGISLLASPISDGDDSSAYFNADLVRHDVLAVFVRLENHRTEDGIVVWSEGFELRMDDGPDGRIRPVDPVQLGRPDFLQKSLNVIAILGVVTLAPFIIAAIPLILIRNSRFARVRAALPLKRIWSHTVEPGGEAGGFLYFPMEKGWLDEPMTPTLIATVDDLGTNAPVSVALRFELSR